ncbi:MAG: hypothetical protein GOV15_02075, partial [Candidatus Diapherotrites archaeon]|nr:hypothetical protein [Candidatus Diapherotrites archaeon]
MLVFESKGLRVQAGDTSFVVDQQRRTWAGETASFITHAHSDHVNVPVVPKCDFFMSPETRDLIGKDHALMRSVSSPFKLDDFDISFHNAGHCLGSKQIRFSNGQDVVLTGDMKLESDVLLKGAEVIPSDVLVIDSTFGRPEYVFPSREQVYGQMALWISAHLKAGASVILSGYRLGKGQE